MVDKRLWREAKSNRRYLFGTILMSGFNGILILGQAYLLATIVGRVFLEGQTLGEVGPLFVPIIVVMALRAVVSWTEEWMALQLAHHIQGKLRTEIIGKIHRVGPVHLRGEQTGSIINLATEGIDVLEDYFARYLPQLFKCAVLPILFLIFVFQLDLITGLVLLCTAPLVPFFMMLIGSWTNKLNEKQWGILSRMSGYLQDVIQGLATLKMLNRSDNQAEKIAQISDDFRVTTLKVLRIAFISALALELLTTLSIALVAVGLGLRLVEGMIVFQEAFFLILLAPDFYLPLRTLGSHYHASLNGIAAAKDIFCFLQLPEGIGSEEGIIVESIEEIVFEQVDFAYDGVKVIDRLSFTMKEGEKIALVGPSGGGKSTILNLLAGFIQPDGGEIRVNGYSLNELNQEQWRAKLGILPQKPYLFAGTIAQNIAMGKLQDEEVKEIIYEVGLTRVIDEFPQREQTEIGSGGHSVSGGQQQLIAMARIWKSDFDALLMDEATANMDVETEQMIQEGIKELTQDKMAIIAAHRLSTIAHVDQILLIDQGRIAEAGNHQQLMAKAGRYYQMISQGGVSNE